MVKEMENLYKFKNIKNNQIELESWKMKTLGLAKYWNKKINNCQSYNKIIKNN